MSAGMKGLEERLRATVSGVQCGPVNNGSRADRPVNPDGPEAADRISTLEAEVVRLRGEVVTFCAPWAVTYARDRGLPEGHLVATHYDILERAGARMDDFTRALAAGEGE